MIRDITRTAIGGYVKLLRLPLDTALRVAGRGKSSGAGQAVDHVDATAREVAGAVTGDEELKEQGRRKHKAAEQRGRAADLKAAAEAKRQEADQDLDEGRERAQQRRKQAGQRAQERRQKAAQQTTKQKQSAKQSEQRRKAATAKATAKAQEAIDDRARDARLEQLDRQERALTEQEEAVTASDEAQRLEKAASQVKEQRKRGS
jgi:hypothetical protein